MDSANTNNQTQPNSAMQVTQAILDLTGLVESVRDQVTALAKVSTSKDEVEEIVQTTLQRKLEGYDKTTDILKKVDLRNATLNRGMTDGFKSIESKLSEFMTWTKEKLTTHDSKIDHNIDEVEIIKVRLDQYREHQSKNTANIEQMLNIVTRVDNAIRGDGETNGLVGQFATTKLDVQRMAVDQNMIRAELRELTAITTENSRLHQEQLKLKKKRRDDRDAMIKSIKDSAWYIVKHSVVWALTVGGGLTALTAILQSMIGQ